MQLPHETTKGPESGRIVGAELLLRWKPSTGEISPAIFIPIAEMTGAIVPIGAWVFRAACLAEVDWRRRWGERAPYVSLNVSTRQLSEESLADDFAAILLETGADPARLLLEITETSLMADVEANLRILDIYQQAAEKNGPRDRRFRIEHPNICAPPKSLGSASKR